MSDEYAFTVEPHEYMIAIAPGKMPLTVLTIEQQLFSVRICEYTDPLFIGRSWDYERLEPAIRALAVYLATPGYEPAGWVRAIDFDDDGRTRVRRAKEEAPRGLPREDIYPFG